MSIKFGDTDRKAKFGDRVELQGQTVEVVKCEETGVLMLNIDADQLKPGDLKFIKGLGLTISNPETDKPVALGVDYKEDSFGERVATFLGGAALGSVATRSYDDNDDDDSGFFSRSGSFGGSPSFGGFGGFGGGHFSGGGAGGGF